MIPERMLLYAFDVAAIIGSAIVIVLLLVAR